MTDQDSARGGTVVALIDDEAGSHLFVKAILERQGIKVFGAMTGEEGLELIARTKPDLVLLDNILPDMDSLEVLQHLKIDPHMRHIPVIMFTADDRKTFIARCLQLGAVDYVTKPAVPLSNLIDKVKKALRLAGQEDAQQGLQADE